MDFKKVEEMYKSSRINSEAICYHCKKGGQMNNWWVNIYWFILFYSNKHIGSKITIILQFSVFVFYFSSSYYLICLYISSLYFLESTLGIGTNLFPIYAFTCNGLWPFDFHSAFITVWYSCINRSWNLLRSLLSSNSLFLTEKGIYNCRLGIPNKIACSVIVCTF